MNSILRLLIDPNTMIQMLEVKPQIKKETVSHTFGRFIIEPLERGYGTTLGNALRRVLLSSLPGYAITQVKFAGVLHEFSTIPGVIEDLPTIILNLKRIRFKLLPDVFEETLYLNVSGECEVKAKDIKPNSNVKILTPEAHIATLTDKKAKLEAEIKVELGKGYVPVEVLKQERSYEIGVLPVDAIFSPVQKVNYKVEDARVGQRTDYNRLILEVWTDGSVTPSEAVAYSAKVLEEYFKILEELKEIEIPLLIPVGEGILDAKERVARTPIKELELSGRVMKCFETVGIKTIGDIINKTEKELLELKSFGKGCLEEVKEKLKKFNLTLKENEEEEK